MIVHESIKFNCKQCNQDCSSKGNKIIKYSCKHCSYEATQKGHLKEHQKSGMMELNILANIAAIKQLQTEVLKDTKSLCMMESNTLAKFVAIKQLKSFIWPDTKNLCIKESVILLFKINAACHRISVFTIDFNFLILNIFGVFYYFQP